MGSHLRRTAHGIRELYNKQWGLDTPRFGFSGPRLLQPLPASGRLRLTPMAAIVFSQLDRCLQTNVAERPAEARPGLVGVCSRRQGIRG